MTMMDRHHYSCNLRITCTIMGVSTGFLQCVKQVVLDFDWMRMGKHCCFHFWKSPPQPFISKILFVGFSNEAVVFIQHAVLSSFKKIFSKICKYFLDFF